MADWDGKHLHTVVVRLSDTSSADPASTIRRLLIDIAPQIEIVDVEVERPVTVQVGRTRTLAPNDPRRAMHRAISPATTETAGHVRIVYGDGPREVILANQLRRAPEIASAEPRPFAAPAIAH